MTQPSHPFCYSELHTEDPARARQFYTALFSWPVTVHPLPAGEYTELQPGPRSSERDTLSTLRRAVRERRPPMP